MDNNNDNIFKKEQESEKSLSDSIKDAIISCAREEVRSLLREIALPNPNKSNDERCQQYGYKYFCRPQTACYLGKLRKVKSLRQDKRQKSCHRRPSTAHDSSCTLSIKTKDAYDLKHERSPSLKKQKECGENAYFTTVDGMKLGNNPSSKKYNQISYASSKLIQQSAKLITKNDENIKDGKLKSFVVKAKKNEDDRKMEGNMKTVLSLSFENNEMKKEDNIAKRCPATAVASRAVHTFHKSRPTTALERRALSNRPSTAHLVRAKADDFSKLLLDPIEKHEKKFSRNCAYPLPNVMDENEWENELARHIVSVFNNKTISDIKDQKGNKIIMNRPIHENDGTISQPSLTTNTPRSKYDNTTISSQQIFQPETTSTFHEKKNGIFKDSKKLIDSLKPRMIWITGTGSFPTDWTTLELFTYFEHGANKTLEMLAKAGKYVEYIDTVKTSLCSVPTPVEENSENANLSQQLDLLWRQLILMVNSFSIKMIQHRKFPQAVDLLDTAKYLLSYLDTTKSQNIFDELNGFVKDSLAYYYSKRDKPSAALKYITEATIIQKKRKDKINVVRCNLHGAFILQQLSRYCEAIKLLREVLKMVNNGSLDYSYEAKKNDLEQTSDNDRQVVLLIAVAYHNLCCLQLVKGQIGDACLNSQNCRRLSRLCMNVGSRYLTHFEETHIKAMNELFSIVCPRQTEKEAIVFQRLFVQLLDSTD